MKKTVIALITVIVLMISLIICASLNNSSSNNINEKSKQTDQKINEEKIIFGEQSLFIYYNGNNYITISSDQENGLYLSSSNKIVDKYKINTGDYKNLKTIGKINKGNITKILMLMSNDQGNTKAYTLEMNMENIKTNIDKKYESTVNQIVQSIKMVNYDKEILLIGIYKNGKNQSFMLSSDNEFYEIDDQGNTKLMK